jgi:hypothetical protein
MNTIGLLLVLGLAFFAMKQKSEKTRNMLLVVSALLGFCMFSAEGFMVAGDTGSDIPATCTGTADAIADGSVPVCADAFASAATGTTAASCPAGCTYTAADFVARALANTDLHLLFPSCGEGMKVKVGGTLESAMCEAASAQPAAADWGENICGEGAECNATAKFLGGAEVADDKSNKCGSSLYDSWEHVCTCTDDTKTWALATKCTA